MSTPLPISNSLTSSREPLTVKKAAMEILRRRQARQALIDFTQFCNPKYRAAEFHRKVAAALDRVLEGEVTRLMIMLPPRHGKSTLASRNFPAMYLGRYPERDVISACYGSELALDFSRDVQRIVSSPEYRALYPGVTLAPDSQAKDRWHTNRGGGYVAAGIGTAITGRGANCLVASTKVVTEHGEVPINEVYSDPSHRFILSFDANSRELVFRPITARFRRQATHLYRVRTASGRVVDATGEHPFFTSEGYKPASLLAKGAVLLRVLSEGSDSSLLRTPQESGAWPQALLLFKRVLGACRKFAQRQVAVDLPSLQRSIAPAWQTHGPFLRRGMQTRGLREKKATNDREESSSNRRAALRHLQPGIQAQDSLPAWALLLGRLRESWARFRHDGGTQSWLAQWDEPFAATAALSQSVSLGETQDSRTRWPRLCNLSGQKFASRTPYRLESIKQQAQELSDLVQEMPHTMACSGTFEAADDFVALVEHLREPAEVFDLTVDGTHCFFANGILVHNCFPIDDPVKSRADAESEQIRKLTWDWYRAVAYTRLMPGAAVVLTLTRWHEEDLCGKLLQEEANGGDQWEKIILPAIDPVTGKALWEEAYPLEVLQQIRRTIGEYDWHALYEQQPRPPGGSFFTEADLLVGGAPVDFPPEGGVPVSGMAKPDYVFAVIDTAVKTGKQHDGLAVTYFCGIRHQQMPWPLLVLDYDLKQMEGALLETWLPTVFQQLQEFAEATKALYGSLGAWIEDKASGMVLLQQAQNHGWPAQAIESGLTAMGKAERAIDVSTYVRAGHVKFTRQAYERVVSYKGVTKNHLLSQILAFRAGTQETASDDLLDTFSYGAALALGNKLGF